MASLPYFFGQAAGGADRAASVRSQAGLVVCDPVGTIVGFVTYHSRYPYPGSAEVTWMAVRQQEHRQGVGRCLLDALDDEMARSHVRMSL